VHSALTKICKNIATVPVSAGLTIVANVALATGPALLGIPRSSAIKLIYYIIYKIFFQSKKSVFF